jgi:FkbM family methyltransferase
VYSPDDGPAGFPVDAVVLLAIWSPGAAARQTAVTAALHQAGFSRIVSFIPLFWAHPEIFLPHFRLDRPSLAAAAAGEIRAAFALLGDPASRQCFLEQLDWQVAPEVLALPEQPLDRRYNEHAFYAPMADEVFVDCGAYTGDTLALFFQQREGRFARFLALEPDPQNFARLQDYVLALPAAMQARITCLPYASSARRETIRFSSGLDFSSRADASGGNTEVAGVPLDEVCAGMAVSYIKMDIEGAEPAAIAGARQTIIRCAPIVAACVYHQQDHLWRLALQLHEMNADYRFFLRRYEDEYGDVVLYAVPPGRLRTLESA